MPSNYAHFRFGGQALAGLDAQLAGCITRERGMFDLGVHGPDFLFYNDPFRRNALEKLGQNVHRATGRAFFTRAAACLRARPDPGAESYLFGALSHFALDSLCHPYIDGLVERGLVRHMALETEFDRQLLALDGVKKPHLYAANRHLRLKKTQQAASIAQFYPGLTDRQVKRCFRRFRLLSGGCVAPRGCAAAFWREAGWAIRPGT